MVQYKACELILKTTAVLAYQLCIVPFGPLSMEGGGRGMQEPTHSNTDFFIFAAISRATDVWFLNVFISLYSSFHLLSNAVFKLFYCKNLQRYSEKKTESRKRWLGFSSFFGFVQTYFAISRATNVRFLNVFISLDLSFH